jgi:hypothetical protein
VRLAWALSLVYAPIAFMAFWHKWDWGGTFGRNSGLWGWGSRLALALLVFFTGLMMYLGTKGILFGITGSGARVYFFLALGIAIVLFPSAASTFSAQYIALAGAGITRAYALVGWVLILSASILLLGRL